MTCPATGPCAPFITELELCCLATGAFPDPCVAGTTDPVPQPIIDNALMAASELLWAYTGRQFGQCTVTIRPCAKSCDPCPDGGGDFFSDNGYGWGSYPWTPLFENGVWTNVRCNSCTGSCGCESLCEIDLPYPVCCIDEVRVSGVILDPALYRVDNFRTLVRIPEVAGDCWPKCQNLALEDTEEGTFSITLTYGRPVPALVKQAAATLACQFIKACMGQPCQLPQRMTSLASQGVTVGFLDPQSFFAQGLTGIYLVDLAIKTFNPKGLQKQSSVYSPDMGRKWRRTNTGEDC